MSISRKHHYIPKFYLKGFTNESSEFAIYDIKREVLKTNMFSTKSHFYELDRNTIDTGNEKTDFIEEFYQKLEDKLKHTFKDLQKADGPIQITTSKIFDIQLFIMSTYWRIPKTDGKINKIINDKNPEYLGFKIVEKITGENAPKEFYNKIKNDPFFAETFRGLFPILQFMKRQEGMDIENWRIYYSSNEGKHICSDFPIILRDVNNNDILTNELIFPLTKKQHLIRTKNGIIIRELPPEFMLMMDILIFLQSERYVCCPNKEYLKMLINLKNEYIDKEPLLREYLFMQIDKIN